jgi:hypothetical protein
MDREQRKRLGRRKRQTHVKKYESRVATARMVDPQICHSRKVTLSGAIETHVPALAEAQ